MSLNFGRHRAHGVEQHRQRPVELLAAAGEDHVLLAELDHLVGVADAMVRGRAGRRDRIVDALDLEPGGERRRRGRGHRLRHGERPDPLRALGAGDVGGLDDGAGRRAARAHDDAGALVRDLVVLEAGVADRLLHGDVVPGGAAAVEAHGAAVDRLLRHRASARRAPGSGSRARHSCRRATMPDLASRRLASTSWVLLPMDETMPMPVTTTRLMVASFASDHARRIGRRLRSALAASRLGVSRIRRARLLQRSRNSPTLRSFAW